MLGWPPRRQFAELLKRHVLRTTIRYIWTNQTHEVQVYSHSGPIRQSVQVAGAASCKCAAWGSTRTYGARKELVGELNSRAIRWLNEVLTVNQNRFYSVRVEPYCCRMFIGARLTRTSVRSHEKTKGKTSVSPAPAPVGGRPLPWRTHTGRDCSPGAPRRTADPDPPDPRSIKAEHWHQAPESWRAGTHTLSG
eukprot:1193256-Prorocentrum_minimum.AAC.2